MSCNYINYGYLGEPVAKRGWATFLLFVLGLFSKTKVLLLGTIAISELIIFPLAPILFLKNYRRIKSDGFMPAFWMVFGMIIALLVSSQVNHSPFPYVFKAFAVFYSILCYITVFHELLRDNYRGMYLFWCGFFISSLITIYAFNPQAAVSESGFVSISSGFGGTLEEALSGPMFWMGKLRYLGQIPIYGWYMKMPIGYSIILAIAYTIVMFVTTATGRAAAMVSLLAAIIIVVGGKSRRRMRGIARHIWIVVLLGAAMVLIYKMVYSYAAENNLLNVDAVTKYEHQTERGKGLFSMLVAGRVEFFVDIMAALDNPIFGLGPRPVDNNDYYGRFVYKYGTQLEIGMYENTKRLMGMYGVRPQIPLHSYIAEFWLQYGIFGLIFWLWVFWLIYQHIKNYAAAIPQWYGYFALSFASYAWDIFFSAFAGRETFACFLTCLFFARAIGKGRRHLPYEMEQEARKYD